MNRFLSCLTVCLLLLIPFSAQADASPASLAVFSQQDERIGWLEYSNKYIKERGCRPVSLLNSLVSAFRITDEDQARAMLPELMNLLSRSSYARTTPIDMDWFYRLFDLDLLTKRQERHPQLFALMSRHRNAVTLYGDDFDMEKLIADALTQRTQATYIGTLLANDPWEGIAKLLLSLHDAGFDAARITLGTVGAGTTGTDAPFRSGKTGHFISLMIDVGSFFTDGSVYVLDSLPRAVSGEAYGENGEAFRSVYPFVLDKPQNAFNQTFTASRTSHTIIRLSAEKARLAPLSDPSAPFSDRLSLCSELLSPILINGRALFYLSL